MDVSLVIQSKEKNYINDKSIYQEVEQAIYQLSLDKANFGTASWNPFASFINRGDKVVIKPNLVLHFNENSDDIDAVVTNASILRPIVDYSLKALDGTGQLIIADAPMGNAVFESVIVKNGIKQLVDEYANKGIHIEVRDLRGYYYPGGFFKSLRERKEGDPEGCSEVVLGSESYLSDLDHLERLYGADFNRTQIVDNHKGGLHKYMISNTVLNADVVISVPKLKTHQKTGMTVNLKNLVGINGNKNYLAHYRIGSPTQGGDEYPDTKNIFLKTYRALWSFSRDSLLKRNQMWGRRVYFYVVSRIMEQLRRIFSKTSNEIFVEKGGWYGNDTCWRMCLDLNLILRYYDVKKHSMSNKVQRKYFCLVDGIISGENDGPLCPDPKVVGTVVASMNPYYADYVCSHIMGFDPDKVPYLKNCQLGGRLPDLDFCNIKTSCLVDEKETDYKHVNLHFKPYEGWFGHIEK